MFGQIIYQLYCLKWLIDWLIDWIVFYAISAIFQPYNGGVWNQSNILFVIVYEDA